MSMRDRADLEAGAAQRRGVGQRVDLRVGADALEQRVEDRADRAGVDRAVGVAADPLVDRADVQAGRAADAAQRLPADLVGQRAGAAVVEQHDVHLLRPVAGRDPGPGRGVGVHPLAGRGARQQLQEHVEVRPGRHHLLDADHRDQHLGQGQAHPAVALGLDHDQRAGLGDREVGAGDGRPWRAGTSRAGAAGRPRPARPGRRSGPSGAGRPAAAIWSRKISRISARLRWIAGTRMWLGRSSPSCTISSARSVSQAAMPSRGQRLVEPDLLGGHRLDLDDLVDAVAPWRRRRRSRTPRRRRGPSARSPRRAVSDCLEAEQVLVEVRAACRP